MDILWIRTSIGGIAATVVDIRVIFAAALLSGASAIILAHNHPSGNLEPSFDDKKVTKKLVEAGKALDIKVFDHIIVTADGYTSMADKSMMD